MTTTAAIADDASEDDPAHPRHLSAPAHREGDAMTAANLTLAVPPPRSPGRRAAADRIQRHVVLALTSTEAHLYDVDGGRLSPAVDTSFPVWAVTSATGGRAWHAAREAGTRSFLRRVDRELRRYLLGHPGLLVLVGERSVLATYNSLSSHHGTLAGVVHTVHAGAEIGELQRRSGAAVERLLRAATHTPGPGAPGGTHDEPALPTAQRPGAVAATTDPGSPGGDRLT